LCVRKEKTEEGGKKKMSIRRKKTMKRKEEDAVCYQKGKCIAFRTRRSQVFIVGNGPAEKRKGKKRAAHKGK